jgi:hypothetical protein
VNRCGRDEPMWDAIHMCMVTMLGISLLLSLSQTCKNAMSFLLSFMFSLQQNKRAEQVLLRNEEGEGGRGEVSQIMYTHVSKCKNDKIKIKKQTLYLNEVKSN